MQSGLLLHEYAKLPDLSAERRTLHLRSRLDGLSRQINESLLALEQIPSISRASSRPHEDDDPSVDTPLQGLEFVEQIGTVCC